MRPRLSHDTAPEIEQAQVERWRAMTPAQKADVVTGLTQAVYEMARAGVRHRHPQADVREQFLRLALVVLGPDLACRAFPDAAALTDRP